MNSIAGCMFVLVARSSSINCWLVFNCVYRQEHMLMTLCLRSLRFNSCNCHWEKTTLYIMSISFLYYLRFYISGLFCLKTSFLSIH